MKKFIARGFTLIELLVVIAIIGILSSVVFSSLSSARAKANDVKVKQQLSNFRSAAQLYSEENGNSFANLCGMVASTTDTTGISTLLATSSYPLNTTLTCLSDDTVGLSYAFQASLNASGQYWCVDSTGQVKAESSGLATTTCP